MADAEPDKNELLERLREAVGARYTVERVLGEGGMATVWLARDRRHAGRPVALKVLRPELASAMASERFVQEIAIAAQLNHPHIVPVFDSGVADGLLFFVMPVVEGESLRARLRREPPLSREEALTITEDVASALAYAHAHGVIHRDVKPENVMLCGNEAVVADFGIAQAAHIAGERLTSPGLVLGTPGYMSPEQALGLELDARSDVYGLACLAHEMLLGDRPRLLSPAAAADIGGPTPASSVPARGLDALPHGIEAALRRALAPDPADRFASAAEFVAALHGSRTVPPDTRSVAVLPFSSLDGGTDTEYLGDGIAEEITNALARIRALRVASRTSAFAFKHRAQDVRRIGAELGVASVLEGSVRRAGGRLRVSVHLVDSAGGYQLWSQRFDREMRDVFAVEDEIARSVTRALEVILSDAERNAPRHVPTSDMDAYDFFLRGRQFFHQTRRRSLEFAREMFQRAIQLDPSFALAHAGIANCSSLLHMYYPAAQPQLEEADAASARALALAPDLPDAHASRGFALFQLGRYDDAAAEFQTAIRLDPSQFDARYFYARQCFQRGALEDAARWFEAAAGVREDYQARFFAAQSYEALGQHENSTAAYARALTAAERHLALHPDDPRAATMCAVASFRLGSRERGLHWAERAIAIDADDPGVRYNVACLFALQGERERALDALEQCVRLGFGSRDWFDRDPDLDSLRADARYQALVGS